MTASAVRGPSLGLVINPIAGMGGRVGLHGTDGPLLAEARERGATPVAADRARRALGVLRDLLPTLSVHTAPGAMGRDVLPADGWTVNTAGRAGAADTTASDTTEAIAAMAGLVDLILFVGGDGTARDVVAAASGSPVLGVPSGVKMHSGVFATGPEAAGVAAARFLGAPSAVGTHEVEIVDQDVDGLRLYDVARVPDIGSRLQRAKSVTQGGDDDALAALGREVASEVPDDVLYLLGPGTTVAHVGNALGVAHSMLGVDAVLAGQVVAHDASEQTLLTLLAAHDKARLVLGVVGGQGFVLGRGNQQLSPAVLRAVGTDNIEVLASATKLAALDPPVLRVDLDDPQLEAELSGYRRVRTAPRRSSVHRFVAARTENDT